MSDQKATKPPIPRWAWIFAVACFVIPVVTLGGAIPAAIGAFSGLGVIAIARQTEKPTRSKVIHCGVLTGSAWTVFVVFLIALTALQAKYPKLNPKRAQSVQSQSKDAGISRADISGVPQTNKAELTEEERRDIYMMAMRTRNHIEFAEELGSSDEHIERLEEMHEKRLAFTLRFHKITREQLDEIIDEGLRNNWPTE